MIELSISEVFNKIESRQQQPYRSFPENFNFNTGVFYPHFIPKFKIDFSTNKPIYTIGSCFAREVEENLFDMGCNVPTRLAEFEEEIIIGNTRPNFILNEYNPGCINQLILNYLEISSNDGCVINHDDGYTDLTLPPSIPVTLKRIYERRKQIDSLYSELKNAEAVILTLGFTECWFDKKTNLYLNRIPPRGKVDDRFCLRVLDFNDCITLLTPAIDALVSRGIKVVITVSPVPILATMMNRDCTISNEHSKSTLRAVVDFFYYNYDLVDYYPSFEVVRLLGSSAFLDDNRHVKSDIIRELTKNLIKYYR